MQSSASGHNKVVNKVALDWASQSSTFGGTLHLITSMYQSCHLSYKLLLSFSFCLLSQFSFSSFLTSRMSFTFMLFGFLNGININNKVIQIRTHTRNTADVSSFAFICRFMLNYVVFFLFYWLSFSAIKVKHHIYTVPCQK